MSRSADEASGSGVVVDEGDLAVMRTTAVGPVGRRLEIPTAVLERLTVHPIDLEGAHLSHGAGSELEAQAHCVREEDLQVVRGEG